MCHEPIHASRQPRHSPKRRGKGFTLPLALFIIIVLGLLAAVLYRTVAIGNLSVLQETLSARAFFAADSGAQAAMMRLFPTSGVAAQCTGGAGVTQALTGAGFHSCSVTVVCSSQAIDGVVHYQMVSTATCTAGDRRASRVLDVAARGLVN